MLRCAFALLLAAVLAPAAVPPAAAQTPEQAIARAGLVDVGSRDSTIAVEARYATPDNFTGRPLPGYCGNRLLALERTALALARVQRALRPRGLGLKVLDAYRPARATRAMVRWARRTGNEHLLSQGYIARRSNHARGTTVDLTLVRLSNGRELDMGTAFDAFTPRSSTRQASGSVLRNRMRLVRAMERQGFANYRREWWHFDSRRPGPRRLDLAVPCRPGERRAGQRAAS